MHLASCFWEYCDGFLFSSISSSIRNAMMRQLNTVIRTFTGFFTINRKQSGSKHNEMVMFTVNLQAAKPSQIHYIAPYKWRWFKPFVCLFAFSVSLTSSQFCLSFEWKILFIIARDCDHVEFKCRCVQFSDSDKYVFLSIVVAVFSIVIHSKYLAQILIR